MTTFLTVSRGLLAADMDGQFMAYLKRYLMELFGRYSPSFPEELPRELLVHHLAGSFAETIKWWVAQDMAPAPETVARYYMMVVKM